MRRLVLFLAILLLAPVSAPSTGHAAAKTAIIGPVEANQSLEAGQLTLIDIRHPGEWRETGLAAGATAVTMHDPKGPNAFLDAVVRAVGGDLSRPVALICASGVRSTWAQRFLAARGFRHVYNVKEGMLGTGSRPGWIRRGLPVQPYMR